MRRIMYATILEKASRKIKKNGENNNNKGLGKVKNNVHVHVKVNENKIKQLTNQF